MLQRKLVKRSLLVATVAALGTLMAGCASSNLPASVKGGECYIFQAPDYAIRGKRQVDQNWIDDNTEAGIAACNWHRPKKRPSTHTATHQQSTPPTESAPSSPAVVTAVPKKKLHWWQRIHLRKKSEQ